MEADGGTNAELPQDFEEVLGRLEQMGIHFLAASGRTYPSVRANFGGLADRVDYNLRQWRLSWFITAAWSMSEQILPELAEKLHPAGSESAAWSVFLLLPQKGPICSENFWLGSVREQQWIFPLEDCQRIG